MAATEQTDSINRFAATRQLQANAVTASGWDPAQLVAPSAEIRSALAPGEVPDLSIYSGAANRHFLNAADASQRVESMLQAVEAENKIWEGGGAVRDMAAGHVFSLIGHDHSRSPKMMRSHKIKTRSLQYALAMTIVSFCTSCAAVSSMGLAKVSESNGVPCFSVPSNLETRDGVPLYSLYVSERKSADWRTLPKELWRFSLESPGNWIITEPEKCIRYGEMPASAKGTSAELLRPFNVYVVSISARPHDSGVVAYRAEFCIKPTNDGRSTVQVIPWDKVTRQWRYDVCNKP